MSTVCDAILSDSEDDDVEPVEGKAQTSDKKIVRMDSDSEGDSDDEDEDEEEESDVEEGEELVALDVQPVQIDSTLPSKVTFAELGVHSWLANQLKTLNITKPTPVQAHCVEKVMEGCDVLGCAKTGTGKTLAFALPILQSLAVDPYGIYALVLTPTRELAMQIADQFDALGKPISLKCLTVVGGLSQIRQASELTKCPHVVVATPGRLADHIASNPEDLALLFKKIQFFVLDEADRMLDGQFNDQLKTIFEALPKKRQTLLFSATITSAINQLHRVSVKKPYFFEDKSDVATVDKLEQKYVVCPVAVKDAYLVYVVKNFCERNEKSSVIIFAQTCRECQALALMFNGLGMKVGSFHSQAQQRERMASLAAFRSKTLQIIVCTDVASRGLDIPHVDLVVNHNVPQCPKTYVHRVGRSARAGRYGSAVTFITQYDVVLLQAVEAKIGKKLEELEVNHKQVTQYVTKVLVAKREAELRLEQTGFGERADINKRKDMLMSGMSEEAVDAYMEAKKARRVAGTKRNVDKIDETVEKKRKGDELKTTNKKDGNSQLKRKADKTGAPKAKRQFKHKLADFESDRK